MGTGTTGRRGESQKGSEDAAVLYARRSCCVTFRTPPASSWKTRRSRPRNELSQRLQASQPLRLNPIRMVEARRDEHPDRIQATRRRCTSSPCGTSDARQFDLFLSSFPMTFRP